MSERFTRHVGLHFGPAEGGRSHCTLQVQPFHFNSAGVVHGGVMFTLADSAMGAALYGVLGEDAFCTTVEIKINYLKPVTQGLLACDAVVVHQGRTLAYVDGSVLVDGVLVAKANGTFAILKKRGG